MAEQSIDNNDISNSENNELVDLEVGQILKGHVSHIGMNYALVLVDKYEFILPKEEISWTKNTRIKDYIKLDDDIEVVVVKVEEDRAMVSLKRCHPNPWITIDEKYSKGQLTKGKVVNIKDFGAFIELEPDVRGLLNKSEMSLDGKEEVKKIVSAVDIFTAELKNRDLDVTDIRILTAEVSAGTYSISGKEAGEDRQEGAGRRELFGISRDFLKAVKESFYED